MGLKARATLRRALPFTGLVLRFIDSGVRVPGGFLRCGRMKIRPLSIRLLALLLAFAPLAHHAAESAATAPALNPAPQATTLIVVRHAERVVPDGDVPLGENGRERAALLTAMLAEAGVTHVFTSQMIRARETAAPLAAQLGLTPTVIAVEKGDDLVAQLKQLPVGAVALVVNHGGTIPGVLQKFGAAKPAPIPENAFDRMFIVTRDSTGNVSVVQFRYGRPPAQG